MFFGPIGMLDYQNDALDQAPDDLVKDSVVASSGDI